MQIAKVRVLKCPLATMNGLIDAAAATVERVGKRANRGENLRCLTWHCFYNKRTCCFLFMQYGCFFPLPPIMSEIRSPIDM